MKLIPFRIPGGTKKTVGEGGAGDYEGLRTKGSKIQDGKVIEIEVMKLIPNQAHYEYLDIMNNIIRRTFALLAFFVI